MLKRVKRFLPKKIRTGLELLNAGKAVTNIEAWKKGQVTVECVSAFLWACVAALAVYFNTEVQVGGETIDSAAGAVVAGVAAVERLYSAISTVITTNKIGLDPDDEGTDS